MLIKMITTMSGPDISAQAGQEIDMPSERADQLISGGFAVPVKSVEIEVTRPVEIEKAVIETPGATKNSRR